MQSTPVHAVPPGHIFAHDNSISALSEHKQAFTNFNVEKVAGQLCSAVLQTANWLSSKPYHSVYTPNCSCPEHNLYASALS